MVTVLVPDTYKYCNNYTSVCKINHFSEIQNSRLSDSEP